MMKSKDIEILAKIAGFRLAADVARLSNLKQRYTEIDQMRAALEAEIRTESDCHADLLGSAGLAGLQKWGAQHMKLLAAQELELSQRIAVALSHLRRSFGQEHALKNLHTMTTQEETALHRRQAEREGRVADR